MSCEHACGPRIWGPAAGGHPAWNANCTFANRFFQTMVFTANKPEFFSAGGAGFLSVSSRVCPTPGVRGGPGGVAHVRHRPWAAQPWAEAVGLEGVGVPGPGLRLLPPAQHRRVPPAAAEGRAPLSPAWMDFEPQPWHRHISAPPTLDAKMALSLEVGLWPERDSGDGERALSLAESRRGQWAGLALCPQPPCPRRALPSSRLWSRVAPGAAGLAAAARRKGRRCSPAPRPAGVPAAVEAGNAGLSRAHGHPGQRRAPLLRARERGRWGG